MRITKGQLRQIIREEATKKLLKENRAAERYNAIAIDITRDLERLQDALQLEAPADCDWGDTGSLASIAEDIKQIADRLTFSGEYAD